MFCLKVKLLKIHVRQMIFNFQPVVNFLTFAQMVSTSFFELSQFEQLNITPSYILVENKSNANRSPEKNDFRSHDHFISLKSLYFVFLLISWLDETINESTNSETANKL